MRNFRSRCEELINRYEKFAPKSADVAALLAECKSMLTHGGAMADVDDLECALIRAVRGVIPRLCVTTEMLRTFGACDGGALQRFGLEFPQGLDIAPLWGSEKEASELWGRLLQSWLKEWVGWGIAAGILPARIRADLRGADLSWANLQDADLRAVDLRGANLRWAILDEAHLRNLPEADLQGASLVRADLRGANLRKANLTQADLTLAYLHKADLWQATLTHARLRLADLQSADLREATLAKADLRLANLRAARLDGADLDEADLREAIR